MDVTNILAQLRKERDALNTAIANLERLERLSPSRPPSLVVKGATNGANHGHRPPDLQAEEA
jgi:hypothetical protein